MFQRLANNFAKNGYFPTDADTIERVLSMLQPCEAGAMRVIDPCAGEGTALAECKAFLGAGRAEAFGVEFDPERAWHAKELLDRALHGDFQETVVSPKSFGLLWLNPPYGDLVSDQAATGDAKKGRARLEKVFYQRAVKLLQPGGVMVLIVPHYTLDKEFAGWIAGHFERVEAFLAPVQTFKQAVVVGVRANPSSDEAKRTRMRLLRVGKGDDATVLPETWQGEPYRVPKDTDKPPQFLAMQIDPAQLQAEILRYPCLWPQFDMHFGKTGKTQRQPLRALSRWHLALSLAAGQVSGVVRSNDGGRVYVIKGDTFKKKNVVTTYEETTSGNRREIRTATDVFVAVIRALDFTPGSPTFGEALVIQ
jgi:hypothetical protein